MLTGKQGPSNNCKKMSIIIQKFYKSLGMEKVVGSNCTQSTAFDTQGISFISN